MYVDMFPRMEIVDYKLGVLPPLYRDNHAGNIAILRTCHYLAGGGTIFFWGGGHNFFLLSGGGPHFFKIF